MKRKINPNGYDIVAFDCDSTLSAVEGIDLLAKLHGVEKQVEKLTNHAMNGQSSFAEALSQRLNLVKPEKNDLDWLGQEYIKKTVSGVKELIDKLYQKNKDIYIISGGFSDALKIFADHLGINESRIFSNKLFFDNYGKYKDFDRNNPLSKNHGKKIMLEAIAKRGSTLFVGDGVTDLEAKDHVNLFVGFGGIKVREIVKKEADVFIEDQTLDKIYDIASGKYQLEKNQIRDNISLLLDYA